MRRFRPVYGIALVAIFMLTFLGAEYVLEGGFQRAAFERVGPGPEGAVRIGVGDLEAGTVRFYRFLNSGNQEVKFFVGRDDSGTVQVGFDANEICFKRKRGYRYGDGWLVCQVCDKSFRLSEINNGQGGCAPVPVKHHLEGDELVIAERDMLEGWRYFR